MPKTNLSAAFVREAVCPAGKRKIDYYDQSITGFVAEIRSTGGKTYYLRYQDPHERQRQLRIGSAADITFEQARKKAIQLRSQVVLEGDPAAEKEARRAIPTYGELAVQHLAYAKSYQKSYSSTEINLRVHILPRWSKLKLTEIHQKDVAIWLAQKGGEGLAPATVEKIRVLFHRSFELARRWNVVGSDTNPVKGIPRMRIDNARERYLSRDEIRRLLRACEASINPQLKYIVALLVLSGARKSELLFAKWDHIDVDRQLWLIPTSKNGKHRYVPLSQAALTIIDQLPKFDNCPWLIPNPETRQPYVSFKHSWETARDAAGLKGLHVHDLRHTAASLMAAASIDLYTIGKVLGHQNIASSQRYSHLADDKLLAAVEAGAAKMKGVLLPAL